MFEDMRRKSSKASRLRLSPNEEAQLVKEELDRRRKLRLQQVREQERYIAQQVRRQVRERRETHVQILADALQHEWQQERADKLQILAKAYEESLLSVGHAHRSARENESDFEAGARRSMERLERAADRHRQALRELTARRHEEEQQRCRHVEARKKALLEEKKRALRVASLPPPPANPVESVGTKVRLPLKSAPAERFSVTHHHMPETAVDRETDTEQLDARQAAEEEVQRLEEVQREEACARLEKLEKARLRGNHALKKEQDTQNRTRLLSELERLQQADLLRRRQAVNNIPAQIFQPLYRQEEVRDEQQRDLEIAFHDMYTKECEVRGELVLQLVPEPLPQPSAGSPNEDLDVTLDPDREEHYTVTETPESSGPSGDPDRRALRRLLDRIRDGRDRARQGQSTAVEATSAEGDDVADVSSIETGTLGSREGEDAGSVTESEAVSEVSDEPVVEGMIPLAEDVTPVSGESEKRECIDQPTDEAVLLRQQQEQLVLLEELEEKQRELEWHLKEAQQERQMLEDAALVRSGIEEVRPLPDPAPEVTAGDTHTRRLHQYQQRLLEQNRRHKKCVEDAQRRLEEYQHTLKLRHAIGIGTAAQTLQPSSVCPLHPPNIRTPVHQSSLERDAIQTHSQQDLISPGEPASFDVIINPSVLQSRVSVQWSEDRSPEETSHDARVEVGVSEREQVPLPPPSVVLELLRSRQHRAAHAEVCDTSMPSFNAANAVQTPARTEKGAEPAREHDRGMSSAEEFTLMNTLLKAIEESSSHAEPPRQRPSLPLPVSNECAYEQQVRVNRGKVKPPVSRPSARVAFLQQMEAHELSAIQEVDTPVNMSLDAEVSESCSVSLPAVVSDGSVSERSQVMGRLSRMSWREALLIHSNTSASSINQQPEFGVNATPDRSSVDGECLSSTTVSTGSFSTSEHEPNCTITDSHIEPVGKENWVFQQSPKSTSCQSPAMRASVQQIIDKYTKDMDASLRTGSVHTGVNISSVSWSSVLQQDLSHYEDMCERRSSAVDLSNAELTGDFLPLQPHPDIDDSSSSSSSRDLVRNEQGSRMQGWNEAVNRIIERFSGQLWSNRGRLTGEPSSMSKDQVQASDFSQSKTTSVTSVLQTSIGPQSLPSEISRNSASPQADESNATSSVVDQMATRGHSEGCESVLSQLIGRASDITSSQVLDESNAPAGGLREMTLQQTVGAGDSSLGSDMGMSEISSAGLQRSEASNDDTSDCFLSLPTEVTHNESLECSLPACIAIVKETSRTNISTCPPDTSASDCLEPTDASLPSFAFDASLNQLRADTLIQSKSDLHISMEQLSLTCDSLCETDIVAPPTASDVSRMRSSPCAQDEKCNLVSHSAVENTLDKLLDRVQELGDVKGILEESTISFVSLPESTLQDPDITGLEEQTESVSEAKPGNESLEEKEMLEESDLSEGKVEGSSPSKRPESSFSHKVMLEFQSSSPRQQEALLRRRHHLAQRSALRAADVKAKRAELRKMSGVVQNVSKPTLSPDHSVQKFETAVCRLKTVSEIKICIPEKRCLEEVEMYQRTQRLYRQLEEVKQKKELHSCQKAHAKNREKAKEFHRKTLEKLRAKQNG
ncbi:centrosomal protein of 295 kDa isoform X5 [Triplophysa rosa]|uniref:centrosomal protein of 295 kDa isoform X5 n=1 Tax=Triplophysa rosa TaxID=992332 RepID=UPI00254608CD|nr:centrosomal protein of 295 kDa isoform X5 [Triplophysa rosa]